MHSEDYHEQTHRIVVTLITTILVCLIVKFYFDKHLSLDGAGYFLHILENRQFTNSSAGRLFSEYLTEWPLVLAVHMGINNIPILLDVFSFGLFLPYVISFLGCIYALRDGRWSMMFFPLASYILINMNSDYILVSGHHVMVLMSWPILFILLIERPLLWKEGVLLWILLAVIGRSYETAIVPNLIFVFISIYRLYRFNDSRERIIVGVSAIFLLVGIIVSLSFILVPRSVINRQSFLDAIPRNLKINEVLYYVSFLFIFLCGWTISRSNLLLKNVLYVAALIPICYYCYLRVTTDYAITSYWSFSSRTLSGLLLPGMLIVAIVVYRTRWVNSLIGIYVFGFSALIMIGFNLKDLSNWVNVKNQMQTILLAENGREFISIEDTVLKDNHYRFSWNNPTLSLIWSYPCVRRIITNGDAFSDWEPFNPKKTIPLKEFLMYERGLSKIDPRAKLCD